MTAQRRQVASDATKGRRSRLAAEGARDLLLNFDHPHIPLRLVIGPSRQLHRLHLLRKEYSRSPIPFILCTASSLRSSTTATIGENIVSFFTRPRIMCARSQRSGRACCHLIPASYSLPVALLFRCSTSWLWPTSSTASHIQRTPT